MISKLINLFLFGSTFVISIRAFREEGRWSIKKGGQVFRFFTQQSNVLCALGALSLCLFPEARWAWLLKYVGTAAVTVTMMTVFFFLGPSMGGYGPLLKGSDFFMHLVTPILAIVSFCAFERRGMSFATAMLGMLPVALYGVLYLYKIIYARADRRWEDFYGFNRGGKWPVAFAAMMAGGFLICMGLMAVQNL